ncbi:MAG TPA: nuclear transport factor 2 family protein [Mycobacteriales bacterium]
MERAEVMRWVDGYERVWRDGDLDGVARLFTEDARYRRSPYEEPDVGHAGIRAFWLDDDDRVFTVSAEPVAVEGRVAVVRLEVGYGDPVTQEYRDLWVLRFAGDGRVEDFEEWPHWPGEPHAATPT